jgi:hypothetical protein
MLLGVTVGGCSNPSWAFQRRFASLRIGMSMRDVDQLFGKSPEHLVQYREYTIAYYLRPDAPLLSRSGSPTDAHLANFVQSADAIPYVYAAAQVAFDHSRTVLAFTQNGESVQIVGPRRIVQGVSSFAQLGESFDALLQGGEP